MLFSASKSSTPLDITTPTTTIPVFNPTTPTITTTPLLDPISNPAAPTSPVSLSGSWCVVSRTVSQITLQIALDYACGYGGADCSAIQLGGSCYNPNSVRDHASYAFNDYYRKNPLPTSCNFGGTAMVTNIDPSSGTCQYPSTSTSSSVLNTTNPTGSAVYGSRPTGSTNPAASMPTLPLFFTSTCLVVSLLAVNLH
ncbi:hypothetical protein HHK36_003534 [Tetracentron sinense]|uniref:X8 domain-containing protein n=1 Tax=Tetracentron sinense TaxID=13715 RepID=A0A834ZT34_TETSI|nr:hypothetical protein HHK36_003534 [Tetracentron sinense]